MTNRDERRGRDANLAGKPFNTAENIDWQTGWESAQADRRLDEWDDYTDEEKAERATRRAEALEATGFYDEAIPAPVQP